MQKTSPLLGFHPRTVQPIANRYIDYAILALKVYVKPKLNVMYIIAIFLVVNEIVKVTTTVKQKVASLFLHTVFEFPGHVYFCCHDNLLLLAFSFCLGILHQADYNS